MVCLVLTVKWGWYTYYCSSTAAGTATVRIRRDLGTSWSLWGIPWCTDDLCYSVILSSKWIPWEFAYQGKRFEIHFFSKMIQQVKILTRRVNSSLFLHPRKVKTDKINDYFSLALISSVSKGCILLMTQKKDGSQFFKQIMIIQIFQQSVELQADLTSLDISQSITKTRQYIGFSEKTSYIISY